MAAVVLLSCQTAADRSPKAASGGDSGQPGFDVPANTPLWVQLQKDLDGSKLKAGAKFSGEIAEAVILNGRPVIPKGAAVEGRVTNSASAEAQGASGLLSLELDSFTVGGRAYAVKTAPVTLESAPLKAGLPSDSTAAKDVKNAFLPKNGVLQFFLASAVRVAGA